MVVFINPSAASGLAMEKWTRIAPSLPCSAANSNTHRMNGERSTADAILGFLGNGETDFVAAGGDGTVNALLNILLANASRDRLQRVRLGAIGLGSSNDFHKPFREEQVVASVPCKIDFENARLRDVGCLSFVEHGQPALKYFLVNASVGITAEANRLFNSPDRILHRLKRLNTPAAILYAALKTILSFRNFKVQLKYDDAGEEEIQLSNLGVVKSPHFSGDLVYDHEANYTDGKFYVHLCHDMTRRNLLKLFRALSNGQFRNVERTKSWSAASVTVGSRNPFAVEFDGEVITTTAATFSILPEYIKVCQ